jgi:hypothetical protein
VALATLIRQAASPGAAAALSRMNREIDVRPVLPSIRVPALVINRDGDSEFIKGGSRYLAEHIPGARLVEVPGTDHSMHSGDTDAVLGEIEEFLTAVWEERAWEDSEPDRVLATVLFTDRGKELDTAGDGFFASFDGPARAIRCACAISQGLRELGIDVPAGLHTGECELIGEKVGGIAVHVGARVASQAGAGEVLVSSTVKDLVAGSTIEFVDQGVKPLRDIRGEWRLFAVQRDGA